MPFGHEAEIVDPELTTDGTSFRQSTDVQYQQPAIVGRSKFSRGRFPESCLFQFVAVVQNGLVVRVLNGEMRTAGALDFSIFIVGRKLVGGCGLYGNELTNAGVSDSRPIEGDQQRTVTTVKVAGIQS